MKLVFASDSFKGTLSSKRIGQLLEQAAHETFPGAACTTLLVADGGEGTLDAISNTRGGNRVSFAAHDGLMRPVRGEVLVSGEEAFVETASTCGLTLLAESECNPMATSSFGVGECVRFALQLGCRRITVGLGGSCTNDGGMGCLRALGVRFFDSRGNELPGRGSDLARVVRIDETGLLPQAHEAEFLVMSDVDNPLLGMNGATRVFGRQKGASDEDVVRLEAGMAHYAEHVSKLRPGVRFGTAGYGAAGGLGMALVVLLGARMQSGIEELLNLIRFDDVVEGADLVVTGEGCLDEQSARGKAACGIAARARSGKVPVVAICGRVTITSDEARSMGFTSVIDVSKESGREQSFAHAEESYLQTAREFFRSLRRQSTHSSGMSRLPAGSGMGSGMTTHLRGT